MYDERLTAPRTWLLIDALAGVSVALVLLIFGPVAAFIGLIAGIVASAAVISAYGSARIRVVQGSLVAGAARIPLSALGEAHVLDAEETVAWRLHKADPRAFMLLRSYVPTAVRVEVTDPQDPTPYLYLSTRHPRRLADALAQGRDGAASPAPAGSSSDAS